MSGIDSIIEVSKKYIGTTEGSAKHKEIIDLYNQARYSDGYHMTMNDPWCCAFVVAMFQICGMADIIPGYAYCDGMIQTFKQWGRWKNRMGYTPKKGDVVFYDWNGDGSSDHVGIVCDNSFNQLTVIEGNKSDSVAYRKINPMSTQIMGFGVPNYDASTGEPSGSSSTTLVYDIDNEYIRSLPLLKYGSEGIYVKILQVLLNYYNRANLDVDGDFGPCTKSAVVDYQMKHKLEIDGEVGKQTWSELLLK